MDPLLPFIERHGAAVLDGGLASELESRGVRLDDPLWSARALIDRPEVVAAVHRAYLEAGADVIETATYQTTRPDLLASGVALARRERDAFGGQPQRLVAASIGPYGASLADGSEYRGDYGLDTPALAAWHRARLRILDESGADLLAFETIPSLPEAEAITRLLAESEGLPGWISFQCHDGERLADGRPIESAVTFAERCPRIVAVGVNCVAPSLIAPLLARCATATGKPLVAYPNPGGTWNAGTKRWEAGDLPIDLGALAREWRAAGAGLIGGCCRTTPSDIHAIAAALFS